MRSRVIAEWTLGILTVVGTVLAALTFWPRPNVEPIDNLDEPSASSSVAFKISNAGLIPLWDVNPLAEYRNVETIGAPFLQELNITRPDYHREQLSMDDSYTIVLSDYVRARIVGGWVIFSVCYRPWFLPWTRHPEFAFKARILEDGKVHWLHDTFPAEPAARGMAPLVDCKR